MSCERCGSQTPNTRLCRECQLLERAEEETARSHAPPLYECQECGEERAESTDSTCWLCRSDRHERGDDGSPEPVSESDEIATDGGEDLKETTEHGPNGFPYVDPENFSIAGWESGDYKMQVVRSDGECLTVNFTPDQMAGLEEQIQDIRRKHEGGEDSE